MRSYCSELLSCSLPQSHGGKALRVIVAGASGTGKTSLLREVIQAIQINGKCRSLCFAPYPGPYGFHAKTIAEACRSLQRKQSATIVSDPALFLQLMPLIRLRGSIMLMVDEAHELYPRGKVPAIMMDILREGRNLGIGLIATTQRPTACNTALLGVSQGIICGRLLGPADISYSRGWGIVQPLPAYTFAVVLPGSEQQLLKSIPMK